MWGGGIEKKNGLMVSAEHIVLPWPQSTLYGDGTTLIFVLNTWRGDREGARTHAQTHTHTNTHTHTLTRMIA